MCPRRTPVKMFWFCQWHRWFAAAAAAAAVAVAAAAAAAADAAAVSPVYVSHAPNALLAVTCARCVLVRCNGVYPGRRAARIHRLV